METVHVFSDASQGRLWYTGAFIVGDEQPVGVIHDDCRNSMEAELLTAEIAIREARQSHPASAIVLHSDLAAIHAILLNKRNAGAYKLALAVVECNVAVLSDANQHGRHRKCHHHARVTAGIYGERHPRQDKPTHRPGTRKRLQMILEAMGEHPDGVSETRLAQETGLALNVMHKALCRLRSDNLVRVEKPDGVAACDLTRWKWSRGANWGVSVGDALRMAGVVDD